VIITVFKVSSISACCFCTRPPLWSSSQSSWLQFQRSRFDFRRCQISWEVVHLERGSLSLVSITEELYERKSSGSGLEIREYGLRDLLSWQRNTLYPQQLALTSPTCGGRSVSIVRSRTKSAVIYIANIASLHKTIASDVTSRMANKKTVKSHKVITIIFFKLPAPPF
jgi:hypothetical protein